MKLKFITFAFTSLILLLFAFTFSEKPTAEIQWKSDFEAAVKEAKKGNKHLLVNFTGSDWCHWCIKLEKEVFSKESFVKYANKNLVCVKVDFPRRGNLSEEEQLRNRTLATKYGVEGFPTILLMDKDKKIILETGYQRGGPEAYIKHLENSL